MNSIEIELKQIEAGGFLRSTQIPQGLDFSSNDYLGLSNSEDIRQGLIAFLKSSHLLGARGSRLICGESNLTQQIEEEMARLFSVEGLLFFGSGYLANIGVISALESAETEFFSDELNHASIIDGLRQRCFELCLNIIRTCGKWPLELVR